MHGDQCLGGEPVGAVGHEAPAEMAKIVGKRFAARDIGAGIIVLQRLGPAGRQLLAAWVFLCRAAHSRLIGMHGEEHLGCPALSI